MSAHPQSRRGRLAALAQPVWRVFLPLILLLTPAPAHAAILFRACQPSDSALVCRLRSVLTLLDTTAAVLAILLLLAVLAAVAVYKRKARKLSPGNIPHDAP